LSDYTKDNNMGLMEKINKKTELETLEISIRKNTHKLQELISLAVLKCLKSKAMQNTLIELTEQLKKLDEMKR
jgi:hypothetical protein